MNIILKLKLPHIGASPKDVIEISFRADLKVFKGGIRNRLR